MESSFSFESCEPPERLTTGAARWTSPKTAFLGSSTGATLRGGAEVFLAPGAGASEVGAGAEELALDGEATGCDAAIGCDGEEVGRELTGTAGESSELEVELPGGTTAAGCEAADFGAIRAESALPG